jgi:acetoacetate decarboxylase
MKLDPKKIYTMPLIMGPLFERETRPGLVYANVESLMLVYQTDPDAIPPLLPEPYQPVDEPTVTVYFADNTGVDFMAGNGYRYAMVGVAAKFEGQQDNLVGNYCLVMFEDRTTPIITGREHLGIPKIFGDITPIRSLSNGHLRCEVSLWGHFLFGIDVEPMKKGNPLVRRTAQKRSTDFPVLGYKYIPSLEGPPDADYPTVLWTDNKFDEIWLGDAGEMYVGDPGPDDISFFSTVIDTLKLLPVHQVTMTVHTRGSDVLRYDKCGRLR